MKTSDITAREVVNEGILLERVEVLHRIEDIAEVRAPLREIDQIDIGGGNCPFRNSVILSALMTSAGLFMLNAPRL